MSNVQEKSIFPTAYESISTEHKSAKEAGLSKEEAVAFEKKEFSKGLESALLKSREDERYEIIRKYTNLLFLALSTVDAIYAN